MASRLTGVKGQNHPSGAALDGERLEVRRPADAIGVGRPLRWGYSNRSRETMIRGYSGGTVVLRAK